MPFLFKTHFNHSEKNGKGVYASEFIPAGSIYWTLAPNPNDVPVEGQELRQNKVYTEKQWQKEQDQTVKVQTCKLGYYFSPGKVLIGLFDGSYYFNHDPNGCSLTIFDGDLSKMHAIVIRDVHKGEQLTEDYNHWSVSQCEWLKQVMKKYSSQRYQFENEYVVKKANAASQITNKISSSKMQVQAGMNSVPLN